MQALERIKKHLVPGRTYRRCDLAQFSSNVDRHLQTLVAEGRLKKLSTGLYVAPKKTAFGEAPPDEKSLLRAFLKDDHFVVYSPSQFNSLGVGLTQLYNSRVVFNRKRKGEMTVGGRKYTFYCWREAPKTLSQEFLLVELMNKLDSLAEDHALVLKNLKSKVRELNSQKLTYALQHYGTISTQKKMKGLVQAQDAQAI